MRVDHVPCGEFANDSERLALETLVSKLGGLPGNDRWVLLSNVPSAVNAMAIPDEIDLIAVGTSGLWPMEIKHWDRAYLKAQQHTVVDEAVKLNEKIKRLVTKLRRCGLDPGHLTGRFLLTKEESAWRAQRPVHHGSSFFVLSEWRELLNLDGGPIFDDAQIDRLCQLIQPLSKTALTGQVRRIANARNLELLSPAADRFHRVYRGEHIRYRDKVIVHLYDLSASHEPKADRIASREFEALQRLQQSPHVPRLMDSFHEIPQYPGELCYFSIVDPCAPTLHDRATDKRWIVPERHAFAAQALKALSELHACQQDDVPFVNRNITPQTLLVGAGDQPIFTGFDLARTSGTVTVSTASRTNNCRFVSQNRIRLLVAPMRPVCDEPASTRNPGWALQLESPASRGRHGFRISGEGSDYRRACCRQTIRRNQALARN